LFPLRFNGGAIASTHSTHKEDGVKRLGQIIGFTLPGMILMLCTIAQSARAETPAHHGNQAVCGSFHLSARAPTKILVLSGKAGLVKINNFGPGSLVIKNNLNNVTIGAHSVFDVAFDGNTTLSIAKSDSDHRTDGTFEFNVSQSD
jgi:hypothetical protein